MVVVAVPDPPESPDPPAVVVTPLVITFFAIPVLPYLRLTYPEVLVMTAGA